MAFQHLRARLAAAWASVAVSASLSSGPFALLSFLSRAASRPISSARNDWSSDLARKKPSVRLFKLPKSIAIHGLARLFLHAEGGDCKRATRRTNGYGFANSP